MNRNKKKRVERDGLLEAFAAKQGISYAAAKMRKSRGHKSWLDFMAAAPEIVKNPASIEMPKTASGKASKLEQAENMEAAAFEHCSRIQAAIDDLFREGDFTLLKILTDSLKSLFGVYESSSKLRQAAEVAARKVIPVEIIDHFENTFFPALAEAVDNIRSEILHTLPQHQRADFEAAWSTAYHHYKTAANEACNKVRSFR